MSAQRVRGREKRGEKKVRIEKRGGEREGRGAFLASVTRLTTDVIIQMKT